jgi:tRNA (guanine-N1)-methyltransferase
MKITVVTAFPDFLKSFLSTSIVGRGVAAERLVVEVLDLRDFADGAYRQVDDYAFGGGGMVLMAEPLAKALEKAAAADGGRPFVLGTSPQGAVLTQEMVESLAAQEHLFIVCGHYEGLDERFTRRFVDMEVSIGDYVLTGGELPAMVLIDAVARRIPGVVGKESAVEEDSFFRGFLDTPHFTRPSVWRGESVPEALLSGDHEVVRSWRRHQDTPATPGRSQQGERATLPALRSLRGAPAPSCPGQAGERHDHGGDRTRSSRHLQDVHHLRRAAFLRRHASGGAEGDGENHRGPLDRRIWGDLQSQTWRGAPPHKGFPGVSRHAPVDREKGTERPIDCGDQRSFEKRRGALVGTEETDCRGGPPGGFSVRHGMGARRERARFVRRTAAADSRRRGRL